MFSFSFYMVDIQTEMVGVRVDEEGGKAKIDVGGCCYDVVSLPIPQSVDLQRRISFFSELSVHLTELEMPKAERFQP